MKVADMDPLRVLDGQYKGGCSSMEVRLHISSIAQENPLRLEEN